MPAVMELEGRRLMTGRALAGIWLGQDGRDLVGYSPLLGGNDVQDIHIALAGLPADRAVIAAEVHGYGGGEWKYNGPANSWAVAIERAPGSASADLFFEPYQVEVGREFSISLVFDDGGGASFLVPGGAADPDLRMPGAEVGARWVGQDGHDHVGPGPSVGPDGVVDARLALTNLRAGVGITSATLSGTDGLAWQFGTNPDLLRDAGLTRHSDTTKADLFINPDRDLRGRTLTLVIAYADGKIDRAVVVAGPTDPGLRVAAPAPIVVSYDAIEVTWVGQDGLDLNGPGDVHLVLSGLPAARAIVSAALTDPAGGSWIYRADAGPIGAIDPYALPLAVRRGGDATRADVGFAPIRNESGAVLSLRITLDDGTVLVSRLAGGISDPGLRAPEIAPTSILARPGDDLNSLAGRYGTVWLASGTYRLDRPLVLDNPVSILAQPGVTLLFSQAPDAPSWSSAIKIHSGHTTLDGFAVRFAGPIRWTSGVSYGAAVIGTTDNFDTGANPLKVDIVLTRLDLESPPASSAWEEAPRLIRLATAQTGRIADNILKGGTVEFLRGPWEITGNLHRGTVPGTFAYDAFAGHETRDLLLANNRVEPVGASGKTWRFLVLTGSGYGDVVRDNTVIGIGSRDGDAVENPNASEIILTEAYSLHFEGKPAAISPDGRVVQIPRPQGWPVRAGALISILEGPEAGQWRRIIQVLSPSAFLLDSPMIPGDFAISISTGFVNETFRANTIDSRGSSTVDNMVLAGNHFGTRVLDNHLLGGRWAFRVSAFPTERPGVWGWSHAPFLGALIQGNTIEDSARGGRFSVEHGAAIKSNRGRVYMSMRLLDNTVVWTEAFLARRSGRGDAGPLTALTIGEPGSHDPGELLVSEAGNRVQGPSDFVPGATLRVEAGVVNGRVIRDERLVLPIATPDAPSGLRLVHDTGASASDRVTSDGRLQFVGGSSALGYEYRLSTSNTYTMTAAGGDFLPTGLVPGENTVFVRAFDASGLRGPDATLTFILSPVAALPDTPPRPAPAPESPPLEAPAATPYPPPPAPASPSPSPEVPASASAPPPPAPIAWTWTPSPAVTVYGPVWRRPASRFANRKRPIVVARASNPSRRPRLAGRHFPVGGPRARPR